MLIFRIIIAGLVIFTSSGLFVCPASSQLAAPTEPAEVPTLIKSLKTGNEENRVNAADRLGRLWPKQDVGGAFAALIKAMNDPSDQVRVNAASALGYLNAKQAVDVLIHATHDRSSEVVMFTAQALGEIGSSASSAEPELLNLLENNSSEVRKVAAIALAKIGIGVEQAVLVMTEDLNLPYDASRYEAVLALGYMGKAAQPAIPALKSLLKNQAWDVQQQACRTLRNIGTSDAKDALKEYPQSCDSRANIKISVEQEVAMFIEDLSLPDDASRWYAALGLGFMGKAAQPAIPALKNLLKDQSWDLQQEACRSLGKIGTSEALDALDGYVEDCPQKVYN